MSNDQTDSKVKEYRIESTDDGKAVFQEFLQVYQQSLGQRRYIMDATSIAMATPRDIGPEPAAAAAKKIWLDDKDKSNEKLFKLYNDFAFGICLAQRMLPLTTQARRDLEQAISVRPDDVEEAKWNFQSQHENLFKKLKERYARTTVSDISEVRIKIAKINDLGAGGFYEFRSKFTEYANELRASGVAGAASQAELREWAKSGIKNKKVFDAIIAPMFLDTPDCSAEQLFDKVSKYLTLCVQADNDPYKSVTAPEGKVSVNSNTQGMGKNARSSPGQSFSRPCTRCWKQGHGYKDCKASRCAAPSCGAELPAGKPTCPQWRQHKDPKFRFRGDVVPWEKTGKPDKKQFSKKGKDHSGGDKRGHDGKFKRAHEKHSSSSGGGAGDLAAGDEDEPAATSAGRKAAFTASRKRPNAVLDYEEDA
jgi:hypothetical protein